jgi:hypothetical protein
VPLVKEVLIGASECTGRALAAALGTQRLLCPQHSQISLRLHGEAGCLKSGGTARDAVRRHAEWHLPVPPAQATPTRSSGPPPRSGPSLTRPSTPPVITLPLPNPTPLQSQSALRKLAATHPAAPCYACCPRPNARLARTDGRNTPPARAKCTRPPCASLNTRIRLHQSRTPQTRPA